MASSNGKGDMPEGVKTGAELRAMREHGVWQTLLSGTVVRMRTVTPDRLLRGGRVPDILSPLVTKMMYERVATAELDEFMSRREQEAESLAVIESINLVCEAALLYPRIVAEPVADDEICAEDLSLGDRGWIFKLAFQPAEFLKRFRNQPHGDVGSVQMGDDVSPAAEQPHTEVEETQVSASGLPV